MASVVQRSAQSLLRSRVGLRTNGVQATVRSRGAIARRGMASGHGGAKAKSDMPWMVASGAVTIVSLSYILSPPGKGAAHHQAAKAHPVESAHKSATKEAAEARGKGEIPTSAQSTPAEKPAEEGEGMKDEEGQEASADDIKESVDKATDADAPKDAKAAEEKPDNDKWADGAPGQTEAVHDQPVEQQVKKKSGTQEEKPVNMGEARKEQVEKGPSQSAKQELKSDEQSSAQK